jgi:signal transduction histidine kinase
LDWECCWYKTDVTTDDCPYIGEGEEELFHSHRRRILEKCLDCPRFSTDLQQLRQSDSPFSPILLFIVSEYNKQKLQLQSMDSFLSNKTREIKFLHELSVVLQSSMELDEVLSVAMTAITAGKGFGMNRAFLLMTDKERQNLKGYLGVGPRDYEEAWSIWQEVEQSDLSLKEMARQFQKNKLSSEKRKFHDILERLTVPLREQNHIFNVALRERKPILVENAFINPDVDQALAQTLGVDSFLVMPLISRNRRIGVIIADNCITHKPITPQDMQSMETFAFPVAFALERASLHERLQEEVDKLTEANQKLKEQQELIVKMEKMALVGRITSSIAHSIRNPLMIIGGFARSLLKSMPEDEQKREYLDSIVREAKQLEDVLEEVLNYSDSLYPAIDEWDINQLVESVYDEMQGRLAQADIACRLELATEIPPVFIDFKQIAFCVRSILINMLETVTGVREIIVRTASGEGSVILDISDNGNGLSQEAREALMTPFLTTQELGNGSGLPLCKTILERHGIPFAIDPIPEGGTRYRLNLPITKEET